MQLFFNVLVFNDWLPTGEKVNTERGGPSPIVPRKSLQPEQEELATMGEVQQWVPDSLSTPL